MHEFGRAEIGSGRVLEVCLAVSLPTIFPSFIILPADHIVHVDIGGFSSE